MSADTSKHAPGFSLGGAHADEYRPDAAARLGAGTRKAIPPSHHGHDLEHWPLRDALTLGATKSAVPSARAHLRQLLLGWGQAELGADPAVVVSELVTNAVVASAELGPAAAPVLVWLGSDSRRVLVAVADASPQPPVRLNLGTDAEGGRGLALVEALSSRWGWHLAGIAGLRKCVWAEWRLPSRAGQRPATGVPDQCHAV
jgi:anti-sigma regulatory factor (Ser/Thr protein kinase)